MGGTDGQENRWSIEELDGWPHPMWGSLEDVRTGFRAKKEWQKCREADVPAGVPYLPFGPMPVRESRLTRAFEDSDRKPPQPWRYPKRQQPHQVRRRDDDWEKRRERDLAPACESCGATEGLGLHHPNEEPDYHWLWSRILNHHAVGTFLGADGEEQREDLIEHWNRLLEEALDGFDRRWCPKCGRTASRRKTKTPPWRCNAPECAHTFPDEKAVPKPSKVSKAHHGSRYSTCDPWLDATQPAVGVIGVGANNTYGHPTQETLTRLDAHGVAVYRTDQHGDISVTTDGTTWDVRPETLPDESSDDGDSEGSESGNLTITEVQYDAPGNDHDNENGEWVEITNQRDVSVDMTGYTLEDEGDHAYTFPSGFTLDAGANVTVYSGSGTDTDSELYWGSDSAIWNNGGDTASLYDGDGSLIDSYAW